MNFELPWWCFNFEPSTRVFWMQDGNNLLMLAAAGGHYEAIFSKKALLMDTVWASLFSPQNFGKDVHPFWRIFSKWVGSNHNMNSGLCSVVARVPPNGKGSAFAYFQPNMAQVCRYLLRSSCLVCAGLRGAMLKAAVDAGRRAFNQSGCKVCKA